MIGREDGAHHLRASPRYKLFQPTEMTTAAGVTRVHLLNVSAGGALVHAPEPPSPGALLRLQCGDEQRVARVAWSKGPRFGAAFSLPLTDEQVQSLLVAQTPQTSSTSRP
jgi:hypothetical protein